MYELLPAPFGLIRYGVAPDHPEVKAYGATLDRKLGIEGENLPGVISAKDLVGWYNGAPRHDDQWFPDLNCDTVAVVGMGNVAIDVARILLSPIDRLKRTDIPEPVLAHLAASRVKRVVIVGRRGPLQMACTLKELRELSRLETTEGTPLSIQFLPSNVLDDSLGSVEQRDQLLQALPRPRRRLTQFLLDLSQGTTGKQSCDFLFLRSPTKFGQHSQPTSDSPYQSQIGHVELAVNRLVGPPSVDQRIDHDEMGQRERIDCGLVVRSIGYRSLCIDPDLPFDHEMGRIKCKDAEGRVADDQAAFNDSNPLGRLYCTGWAKRGPIGVIVDTAMDARSTAKVLLTDQAEFDAYDWGGSDDILPLLSNRGIRPVSFTDWLKVDAVERSTGQELGKPREKLTTTRDILTAAFADVAKHVVANGGRGGV